MIKQLYYTKIYKTDFHDFSGFIFPGLENAVLK